MLTGPHKIVSTSTSKLTSSAAVIVTSLYSLFCHSYTLPLDVAFFPFKNDWCGHILTS